LEQIPDIIISLISVASMETSFLPENLRFREL
jgi:hypothetical protein